MHQRRVRCIWSVSKDLQCSLAGCTCSALRIFASTTGYRTFSFLIENPLSLTLDWNGLCIDLVSALDLGATDVSLTRLQLRSNIERALVSQQPRANFWLLHSLGEVHYNGLPFVLAVNRPWSLINQGPTAQTHISDLPTQQTSPEEGGQTIGRAF